MENSITPKDVLQSLIEDHGVETGNEMFEEYCEACFLSPFPDNESILECLDDMDNVLN